MPALRVGEAELTVSDGKSVMLSCELHGPEMIQRFFAVRTLSVNIYVPVTAVSVGTAPGAITWPGGAMRVARSRLVGGCLVDACRASLPGPCCLV